MASQEKNTYELMLERLAEGLDGTTKLTQALLTQLRESEADFATIRTELSVVQETVKGLSVIVREGNGAASLITKIALIEQQLSSLDKWIDNHIDIHQHVNKDIKNLNKELKELEDRFLHLEELVKSYKNKMDQSERKIIKKDAIAKKKLFKNKIVFAVILVILGALSTWFVITYSDNNSGQTFQIDTK